MRGCSLRLSTSTDTVDLADNPPGSVTSNVKSKLGCVSKSSAPAHTANMNVISSPAVSRAKGREQDRFEYLHVAPKLRSTIDFDCASNVEVV